MEFIPRNRSLKVHVTREAETDISISMYRGIYSVKADAFLTTRLTSEAESERLPSGTVEFIPRNRSLKVHVTREAETDISISRYRGIYSVKSRRQPHQNRHPQSAIKH